MQRLKKSVSLITVKLSLAESAARHVKINSFFGGLIIKEHLTEHCVSVYVCIWLCALVWSCVANARFPLYRAVFNCETGYMRLGKSVNANAYLSAFLHVKASPTSHFQPGYGQVCWCFPCVVPCGSSTVRPCFEFHTADGTLWC